MQAEGRPDGRPPDTVALAATMTRVPASHLREALVAWAALDDPWARGEYPAFAAFADAWARLHGEIGPTHQFYYLPTPVQQDAWRLVSRRSTRGTPCGST